MTARQAGFISAVLDPERPVPPGLVNKSRQATGRFSVYRNNVVVGLIEALESSFPVIRKLLGDEFFMAMAGIFVRRFPPTSPVLSHFGKDMPEFLLSFPPLAHLPYLPDVARLEQLVRESYHEADAKPVSAEFIASLPPEKLSQTQLLMAPSIRLLRSDHPICSIWRANAVGGPKPSYGAEDVLIARREFDPEPVVLPSGGYEILQMLLSGASLLDAFGHANAECGEVRLDETLSLLVRYGAITEIRNGAHAPVEGRQ